MTLTCKWIKDETDALVMKWAGDDDEFSTMKPRMRKLAELTVLLVCHGKRSPRFRSRHPVMCTTSTALHTSFVSHPWRIR